MDAMKALGLNPGEQEMIDMTNEVSVNGLIYYPEFCKLVLRQGELEGGRNCFWHWKDIVLVCL